MRAGRSFPFLLASGALMLVLLWLLFNPSKTPKISNEIATSTATVDRTPPVKSPEAARVPEAKGNAKAVLARDLLANLQRLLVRRDARQKEGLLTFKDDEAYRRFLARAPQAGLTIVD